MRLWGRGTAVGLTDAVIGRLTASPIAEVTDRRNWIPFGSRAELAGFSIADGYPAVLCFEGADDLSGHPGIYGPANLDFLGERDVVSLAPDGGIRVWYRRSSENNTLLVTEQCNSYCLMCSQPPKKIDDSYRVSSVLRLLELIDPGARELILSGGEPTLARDGFFNIIERARDRLPFTALHVLTNGRTFQDRALAERLKSIGHPDLVLGIPLYSDIDWRHDFVVQAKGAYDETIAGFYNLAKSGVRLELRVVLHRQTVDRLEQLATFIGRNLPFVEHVALMGLEMTGFTPRNLETLWIDPIDYQHELSAAVELLASQGMNVSVYNHQLCTLPRSLWPFARKSISDWKNLYLDECSGCHVREYCGGFFQSATKRHSRAICPVAAISAEAGDVLHDIFGPPEAVS